MMTSFNRPPLEFAVVVLCAGGWQVLAWFASETDAWTYGGRMLDVRVWHEDKCLGHKDGDRMPWKACDMTGPCYQRIIIDEVRAAEERQREDSEG